MVAESLSGRQREAEQAEQIVAEEARGWERWAEAAQATPTIVALRAQFRAVLEGELDKSLKGRLKHLGAEERKALDNDGRGRAQEAASRSDRAPARGGE